MAEKSTRSCVLEVVQRITAIETKLEDHARRVDDHIDKEEGVHKRISGEISEVRDLFLKNARYVIGLLLGIVAYLIVSGVPWR